MPKIMLGEVNDGKYSFKVLILDDETKSLSRRVQEKERNKNFDWIVDVRGYTSTDPSWSNKFQFLPIICLTSIVVLTTIPPKGGSLGTPFSCNKFASVKAHAGTIGSFLTDRVPFLTNHDLVGGSSKITLTINHFLSNTSDTTTTTTDLGKSSAVADSHDNATSTLVFTENSDTGRDCKRVQDFMALASAMKTLKETTSSSSSLALSPPSPTNTNHSSSSTSEPPNKNTMFSLLSPTNLPTEHPAELYSKVVEEFTSSQMNRQNASLGTNAGRETADRAALIIQRHKDTLQMAMKETKPLSTEILCRWHHALLYDIHPEAGQIRTRTVRCGQTIFCPVSQIQRQLEKYCHGLYCLSQRLDMNDARQVVLYASIAMFGIVDIHPFLDGNGRLSRIVANYALRQLPFPVNLFATPGQRTEYVNALERTRHFLSMSGKGNVEADQLLHVIKLTGAFSPLTNLLMDRIAKAALECNKVWQEKSGMAAEEAEARAARRVRERAALGTCIICFEDRPNIATLCCGKATHLNCIAEWLSGNNSCPNCRSEMPSISGRVVRAARRQYGEDDDGQRNQRRNNHFEVAGALEAVIRETEDLVREYASQVALRGRHGDSDSSGSSQSLGSTQIQIDDTTTTSTSDDDNAAGAPDVDTTTDDTTEVVNIDESGQSSTDTTTEEETDDDDETSATENNRSHATFCTGNRCRNRAAVDCTNNLCGRCCILVGQSHCPRHNS